MVSGEKKIPPRKKDPDHYWNTIEGVLTLSAANTLTEAVLQTGVAVGQKRIMLIKKIALSHNYSMSGTIAPGALAEIFFNLNTQQDETAMPGLQDDGTVYYFAKFMHAGGDGATAAESPAFMTGESGMPTYVEFDDPIPVADDQLSLYGDTTLFANPCVFVIKIWYAIAAVSLEEALTILESYR